MPELRAVTALLAENPSMNASGVRAVAEGFATRVRQESGKKDWIPPMAVVPTLATPTAVRIETARAKAKRETTSERAFDALGWEE